MQTPEFIFDLIDRELRNVHVKLITDICNKYHLNSEEVIDEFLPIPKTKVVVSVITKKKHTPVTDNLRCQARIWNRGKGGQCQIKSKEGEQYCHFHCKSRKYGDIKDPVPRDLYPKNASSIYK